MKIFIFCIFALLQSCSTSKEYKNILFVTSKDSHDWGQHEHNPGTLILTKKLKESHQINLNIKIVKNSWPSQEDFNWADSCVIYSDGWQYGIAKGMERMQQLETFMNKGKGVVRLHWATGSDKKDKNKHLNLFGGNMEKRHSLHSTIWKQKFLSMPKHEINNGVNPFTLQDECYFFMRWHNDDKSHIKDILLALPEDVPEKRYKKLKAHKALKAVQDKQLQSLAWAFERPEGGRAFSYTGGHFHWNWANDNLRKLILNAIVWTSGAKVPNSGIESTRPTATELLANITKKKKPQWQPDILEQYLEAINKKNNFIDWKKLTKEKSLPLIKKKN